MRQAFRGSIFHCLADPGPRADEAAVEHIEDGLLIVEDGHVEQVLSLIHISEPTRPKR